MRSGHTESASREVCSPIHAADHGIEWLLNTQHNSPSVVTDAPAGGWGSSDAPGAEPNTIATAGTLAILAQAYAQPGAVSRDRMERAAIAGVRWLVEMQNEVGGWPTYCREDAAEPVDGSGIDPTAQSLRALAMWQRIWKAEPRRHPHAPQSALLARISTSAERGMAYLESQQEEDGSFAALWFGNQHQPEFQNPVMGTAVVLTACAELGLLDSNVVQRAAAWMMTNQHAEGGWGPPRAPVDYSSGERDSTFRSWRENEALARFCSVEESAAAVSALVPLAGHSPALERSVSKGLNWLANAVEQDLHRQPAVIGYYFARIWYYERMYPLAFAAGALSRAMGALTPAVPATSSAT
jgi:squalene-hopene/tetraprenyl-beta-curcumene cyclase